MSNAIYPNSRYGASNPLPRGRQTPLETDGGTAYERVSEALQARWPQDETCGALDERRAYIAAKLWQLSRAPFCGLAAGADRYGLGMSKNELDAQTRDKRALQARSTEKSWWERRGKKLKERLALEQELYDEHQRQWAINQELHAEHQQRDQFNERAALWERGVAPDSVSLTSLALPCVRATGAAAFFRDIRS